MISEHRRRTTEGKPKESQDHDHARVSGGARLEAPRGARRARRRTRHSAIPFGRASRRTLRWVVALCCAGICRAAWRLRRSHTRRVAMPGIGRRGWGCVLVVGGPLAYVCSRSWIWWA